MTITNGYTTLAQVSAAKQINSVNALDDGFIEDLIEAASRFIDGYCGRRFYTTTNDETRTYSAANGARVYTDDIISVTTLKTDDDGDRVYETTWATTDYDLMPENASLTPEPYTYIEITPNGSYWFPGQRKGVQIVGKFGYSTTAPADIEMACRMIVVNIYQNRYGIANTGPATITGAGVVITPQDIPASALKLLDKYRRLTL